jgi:hypothetical protein
MAERGVPLRLHEVPFDLPVLDVELRWHRRLDNDPASQWLRRCVHDAVRPFQSACPSLEALPARTGNLAKAAERPACLARPSYRKIREHGVAVPCGASD